MMTKKFGFIGAGNMAEAMMKGMITSGICAPDELIASEVVPERREYMARTLGITVTADNVEVVKEAKIHHPGGQAEHRGVWCWTSSSRSLAADHLVISIAAGVKISFIEAHLNWGVRVIRVMPNQPCLVGASASGFALGKSAKKEDGTWSRRSWTRWEWPSPWTRSCWTRSPGLAGAGLRTSTWSSRRWPTVASWPASPGMSPRPWPPRRCWARPRPSWRPRGIPVSSRTWWPRPAGTTIEGLRVLEESAVRGAFIKAVEAASKRSVELGKS